MGVRPQHFYCPKQLEFQFQDQDLMLSQSTGQFDHKVAIIAEGLDKTQGKPDRGHPEAPVPFQFVEPCFEGLLSAYGPQAMVHYPQIFGTAPSRVLLPLDFTEDEPIFVNAKQYNAILRRRRHRARLQAEDKLVKPRKPYLHESRHLHALRRARGSGGRFLNVKKIQESKSTTTSHVLETGGSMHLVSHENLSESNIDCASSTSSSEVTSSSNSNGIFHQGKRQFFAYPFHLHSTAQKEVYGDL